MPPQRKDAARNWDRIVAVARELVDEGTPLQLNDVARRAGLGVGTVYRHFATTEALLETVATPCLEALTTHGHQALTADNPWHALRDFLQHTVEAQVTDPSLVTVVAATTDALPHTTELKQQLWTLGNALFARARDAGHVRTTVHDGDIVPLMCGIAYAVHIHGDNHHDRVTTAHRYLDTLLEGLHA
ncbi:TetR/AcrR family transcriptional regulator [Nocardia sp. NRRL S-836]|uniref:TetR/AcrR family transcriptional regulator n=1 Tax=Nocardia sp. NRRL S-836 TaxID=1519492 RepID=UPI0006AE32E7|nr:TetR/AcrR family transcriptional regulator [Nocardia sp. NRRL S-836]KOV89953.1 TetR family transcriptional regulator [Nocardia sp. NRRL S-836]